METSDQCETIGLTECANYQLFFYIVSLAKNIALHSYICDGQKLFFITTNMDSDDSYQSLWMISLLKM